MKPYLWLMAVAIAVTIAGACSSAPAVPHLNCEALEEPRDGALCLMLNRCFRQAARDGLDPALCLHMDQPASQ